MEETALPPVLMAGMAALRSPTCFWGHFPLFLKNATSLQPNSSMIWPISSPFSSNWQCFCLHNPINFLSKDSPVTPLVLSLEPLSPFFCNMGRLRIFQIFKFCLIIPSSIPLSPLAFYCVLGGTKVHLHNFA